MARETKHAVWEIIVYKESAPKDWVYRIRSTGIPAVVSPEHNNDKWDHDVYNDNGELKHFKGELKKEHFHVLLAFKGPTTKNNILDISNSCCNSSVIQWKYDLEGAVNYLDHHKVVSEFKPLYDADEIVYLNEFDLNDFRKLTEDEIRTIYQDIQNTIIDLSIYEYSDLMDYLLINDMPDHYDIARSHTLFFKGYIDSRRNKRKDIDSLRGMHQ